jgi:hypothetical protein
MKNVTFFFQNLTNLSFLLSLHNKIFRIEELHDRSVCSVLHPDFLNNFEDLKFKYFGI